MIKALTAKHRARISKAKTGQKLSQEHRDRIAAGQLRRYAAIREALEKNK